MKSGRGIVEIFGRCSRLLNKIVLNIEDGFFSRLCIKESDKLLSEFIFFLKGEGERREHHAAKFPQTTRRKVNVAQTEVLQHQDVAKPADIVQPECRVAQYRLPLISRIKSILNLLDILKHLGLAKPPTSLLLERDLLSLKLAILDTYRSVAQPLNKAEEPIIRGKTKIIPRLSPKPAPKLGQAHKEISEFIRSKERTQNIEVFTRFSHISRRTLKKKLSDLVGANVIKRIANGKKVFYSAPAGN